jgi:hypothetical protein
MFQVGLSSAIDPDYPPPVDTRPQRASDASSRYSAAMDARVPRFGPLSKCDREPELAATEGLHWSRWENSMADVVAHLVSAYQLLGELTELSVDPTRIGLSADMASHGICAALVSLDECLEVEWDNRVPTPTAPQSWSHLVLGASWRNILGDALSS